ncbi:hypothetical protein N0V87_004402 [Didymella glomerata]|uniref:non-specific serine/threonine protein kinase n=1 Tax=Didymella glomerata TaxID=749621 RepID=A0A9W8X0E0_9PLEO|nr:hypothetical protein N0V87_004402 [Didymella glomerata]
MEYAPFGDLRSLLQRIKEDPMRQVPEPYLWLIFRAQIEALHAMHYGHVLTADTPPKHIAMQNPNWLPIINPDIRLGNAVLGDAQDRYPAFQTVKMIDFGHAFRCEEITDKTKMMGTRYICPPVGTAVKLFQHALTLRQEQWRDENNKLLEAYRHVPIYLDSEIYNVDVITLSLMKGEEQRMPSPGDIFWHLPAPNRCYSSQLHATVISCMRTEHKQRPTVKQLLQSIKYGLEAWEQSYGSADRKDLPEFMSSPKIGLLTSQATSEKQRTKYGERHDGSPSPALPEAWPSGSSSAQSSIASESNVITTGEEEEEEEEEEDPNLVIESKSDHEEDGGEEDGREEGPHSGNTIATE